MEKFNELLEKLNGVKLIQNKMDWEECIPEEIWNEHFEGNFKQLQSGLSPFAYRWYETSISVISIYDKFLGIKHITNVFSESSTVEDCYDTIDFFEMKEVTVISYKRV